jgi:Matrixin
MRHIKEMLTVRRGALAAAMLLAIVVPSVTLHALTAKGSSTNVAVGLVPAVATGPTTATSTTVASAATGTGAGGDPFGANPADATTTVAAPVTTSPAAVTTVAAPVVTTVPVPSGPGQPTSYAFSTFSSGPNVDKTPIRWSPSAAIHYVVNPANAPAGAAADLTQAIAAIHLATGLNFVSDGVTTASTDNAACTAATAPTCWAKTGPRTGAGGYAPVLIGWSPATAPILTSNTSGDAMASTLHQLAPTSTVSPSVAGDFELVSGIIAFNVTAGGKLPAGFGGGSRGAVMLHELGHLVGLAHVTDPDQMMYPSLNGHVAAYGAGDLAGLTIAGHGVTYPVAPRL